MQLMWSALGGARVQRRLLLGRSMLPRPGRLLRGFRSSAGRMACGHLRRMLRKLKTTIWECVLRTPGERPDRRSRFVGMSCRASACRNKAVQCERAAKVATDPDARRVYLDVARRWRRRPEHSEALERLAAASVKGPITSRSGGDKSSG